MEAPRNLPLMPVALAALATGALFRLWPSLDLWIAGWFYSVTDGFIYASSGFAWLMYQLSPIIMWALIGAGVLFLLFFIVAPAHLTLRQWRLALTLLIALVLGPGLLVNAVFKDNWGRARPAQVTEFGGALRYSPPLVKADQCGRNCSFPAGHPSMPFLGFALAVAFAGRRRRQIIMATAVIGALSGLGRMMQGAHFFSDVLFSGFITYAAAWFAWHVTGPGASVSCAAAIVGRTVSSMAAAILWALRRPFHVPWRRHAAAGLLAATAFAIGVGGLDQSLASWFATPEPSGWQQIMTVISELGRPLYWVAGLCLLLVLSALLSGRTARPVTHPFLSLQVSGRAIRALSALTLAAASAYAVAGILKFWLGRSRPSVWFGDGTASWGPVGLSDAWWSLPSSHAAVAMALAGIAARLAPRYRLLFISLALLVMMSRIWLTAHWFSDVVAGGALGLAVAWCVYRLMLRESLPNDRSR